MLQKIFTELLHVIAMGPWLEAVPITTLAQEFFLKPRKALQHEFVAEKVEKPPEPVDTEPMLRAFLNCFFVTSTRPRLELKFSRCFLSPGKNAHKAKKLTQQLQQKRNSTVFLAQFKQSEVAIHLQ